MSDIVLSTVDDGVRTIVLNRPETLNAMNAELVRAVGDAFEEANADPATRAIIFTGAGRAFCSGDDLKEHRHPESEAEARAAVDAIQRCTRAMVLGDKPIIGAINGWAVGGGFEWAINCDLALWAADAKAFFPEIRWGMVVTGGVSALLPAIVGLTKAREMLFLGDTYTAAELHEIGIAWKVVAPDRLMDEARSVARRIADSPQLAVRSMKRVLNDAAFASIERALALETEATVEGFLDPETTERVGAFARGQGG